MGVNSAGKSQRGVYRAMCCSDTPSIVVIQKIVRKMNNYSGASLSEGSKIGQLGDWNQKLQLQALWKS
jgi:hypothetical protein